MSSPTDRLSGLPDRRPLASLALAILACELVGASGSIFTTMGLDPWYASLAKPDFAPPNWLFAPVWTTLFALMGVAVWLVWRQLPDPDRADARRALWVFAGHFVVNVAWSAAFFGLQSLLAGLVVIVLLVAAILVTMAAFDRVDRRATILLVPYLLWVCFATYLNYALWTLN